MRLSEAIMLGAATCKLVPRDMNSCAYGCALNALGVPQSYEPHQDARWEAVKTIWPWTDSAKGIMSTTARRVWEKFDTEVCPGKMTLEQLADYVRSIEPDCDCCRFRCDCKSKQEAPAEVEYAHQA